MRDSTNSAFLLMVYDDDDFTWWAKGTYDADTPEDAVAKAYEDVYLTPRRNGSRCRTSRVAVVGIEVGGWQEFVIEQEAVPSRITRLEKVGRKAGLSDD